MRGDAGEIARQLADHIEALVIELFPRGRRDGRDWRIGSLAGEEGQSLAISLRGTKRGVWVDFASGEGGDALDLVAQALYRGALPAALDWARRWLGLPEQQRDQPARQQRAAAADPARRDRALLGLWLQARPVQPGDPVSAYLASRGIDLAAWGGRIPGALRYHPGLWNRESQRHWPAMVAAICNPAGRHVAVHRTWLETRNLAFEAAPAAGKAPLAEPKRTLGHYRGGCIRLWRGASGRPWRQMPAGETLLLGEGIEDVLAGIQQWPAFRAACAVSLSAMLSLELPAEVATIFLLRQSDPPGSPADRLLRRVVKRFLDQRRRVFILKYSAIVKDINQYIQHPSQIVASPGGNEWPMGTSQIKLST
jgi:hypothetical protein